MKKQLNIFIYFLSVIFSFLILCWVFWARFIRERLVKDIPIKLSEYGFWFLSYICFVYLFIVSIILCAIFNYIQKKIAPKTIIKDLINQIYIPFIMLDHAIKYNNYFQKSYYDLMLLIIKNIKNFTETSLTLMILIFQIIPRIILVGFLIVDTFYFHKLEILYKVILLGLLPFLFRYIKYNFNDFKEHHIKLLDLEYNIVLLFQETPKDLSDDNDDDQHLNSENNLDNKTLTIKEYIEFKIKQHLFGIPNITYKETPFAKQEIYNEYNKRNNILSETSLNDEIYENIRKKFTILTKIICDSAAIYERISYFQNKKMILYLRLFIYTSYFICWFYILSTSYYTYPVDFSMFEILFENLTMYSYLYDLDPYSMLYQHSLNINLITPENVWDLIKSILNKVIKVNIKKCSLKI